MRGAVMAMTMRERIARAVFFSQTCVHHDHDVVWAAKYAVHPKMWDEVADAVLAELEKPTDGMKLAMSDEAQEYAICDSNAPLALYAAAIRAARDGK
jgi:hypothetical protein